MKIVCFVFFGIMFVLWLVQKILNKKNKNNDVEK